MRCPKCNDQNFGDFAILIPKKGWYKGTVPAQLEIFVCQKCGYRDNYVNTNNIFHPVWIANWEPPVSKEIIDG